jgi:hypothetical protein
MSGENSKKNCSVCKITGTLGFLGVAGYSSYVQYDISKQNPSFNPSKSPFFNMYKYGPKWLTVIFTLIYRELRYCSLQAPFIGPSCWIKIKQKLIQKSLFFSICFQHCNFTSELFNLIIFLFKIFG